MSEASFLDQVLAGDRQLGEIDDVVEAWHSGHGRGELRQLLGMTADEYALWVRDPDKLAAICTARLRRQVVADAP